MKISFSTLKLFTKYRLSQIFKKLDIFVTSQHDIFIMVILRKTLRISIVFGSYNIISCSEDHSPGRNHISKILINRMGDEPYAAPV